MPFGTLDRTPPPFFKQGTPALTKLAMCSALAVLLMVADARFHLAGPARSAIALALHPLQKALLAPVNAWDAAGDYLRGTERAMAAENEARQQLTQQAERLSRANQLEAENAKLRALLGLRPALTAKSSAAEVLYEAPDPYSRRVVIDRGSHDGIQPGSPVINDAGVLGQVTRVYNLSSEVTLLTDKDAAIPLLNVRTQVRNIAFGNAGGTAMELRFLAANADVKVGDVMATSGLDGVYPAGLPVAKVTAVERRGEAGFAQVTLQPVAQADAARHVLVLQAVEQFESARAEARAASAAAAASAPIKSGKKGAAR